jgi:hypothetical protein
MHAAERTRSSHLRGDITLITMATRAQHTATTTAAMCVLSLIAFAVPGVGAAKMEVSSTVRHSDTRVPFLHTYPSPFANSDASPWARADGPDASTREHCCVHAAATSILLVEATSCSKHTKHVRCPVLRPHSLQQSAIMHDTCSIMPIH